MYEDTDLWPIKCPSCLNEFTQQIGRIKTSGQTRCPECALTIRHPTEQFIMALAQARDGFLDPWGHMLRIRKPD